MTRVVVVPSDEQACGHLRMLWPALAVGQIRPDWQIEVYRPRNVLLGSNDEGRVVLVKGIPDPERIDLLVLQRPGDDKVYQWVQWARHRGIAVAVDVDDALWCIDSRNPARGAWDGSNETGTHWSWIDRTAALADVVTATTRALTGRYGRRNGGAAVVVPNAVPEPVLDLPRPDTGPVPVLGWPGFTASHPGDLTVSAVGVRAVFEENRARLAVLGDAEGAERDWRLPAGSVHALPPVPLGDGYYRALRVFDVGVVPLAQTPFNEAKSSLKALEMAAAGAVVVASPTWANRQLAKDGVPLLLPDRPRRWAAALRYALDLSPAQREQWTRRARDAIRDGYTFTATAPLWAAAWERAMDRARGRGRTREKAGRR